MAPAGFSTIVARSGGGLPLEDRVIATRVVTIVTTCLVDIVCGLRLYMRLFVFKSFSFDDFLVIVALLFINAWAALALTITWYGLGNHQVDVPPEDLQVFMKIEYAATIGYLWVALAVKTSVIAFILRIFPHRGVHITGHIMNGFMVIFTIANCITYILQCRPIPQYWLRTDPDACYSPEVTFDMMLYQGVVMFVCDLVIIGMPMPVVWKLQMSLKKRLLAMFLFSFGIVACAAALVRFTTLTFAKDTTDTTYSAATSLIWMVIEFNFGLMAGSISSLRQLFRIKSILESSSKDNTPHTYSIRNNNKDEFELRSTAYNRSDGTILRTQETKISSQKSQGRSASRERIMSDYDVEYSRNPNLPILSTQLAIYTRPGKGQVSITGPYPRPRI